MMQLSDEEILRDPLEDYGSSAVESSEDIEKFLNEVLVFPEDVVESPLNPSPSQSGAVSDVSVTSSLAVKEALVLDDLMVKSLLNALPTQSPTENNVSTTSSSESYTTITKRLKKEVQTRRKSSEVETDLMLEDHQSYPSRLRKSSVAKRVQSLENEQIDEIIQHFHNRSK